MLTIAFYGDSPPLVLPQDSDQTTEDVLVAAACVIGISPLCRHLFGLRSHGNGLWVSLGRLVAKLPANPTLEFRLRFKPYSLDRLKALDRYAFDYLFHQVRADFLAGEIPELIKHPEDGLGLVVTDILLHLLNHPGKKVGDIDLKSFMPRELNGMANRLNVKRNAEKLVETCQHRETSFVRERYLFKVEESQCSYGSEEYNVQCDEGGAVHSARLCVDPYHTEHPGLRYSHSPHKKASWLHLCCIEDLVFVTTRSQDLTVEVSRKTGIPCYFKLLSTDELEAFVGCLTGYYRLMCTWTFDLCRELSTPSLVFLRANKCHGPIGLALLNARTKTSSNITSTAWESSGLEAGDPAFLTSATTKGGPTYFVYCPRLVLTGLPGYLTQLLPPKLSCSYTPSLAGHTVHGQWKSPSIYR